MPQLGSTRLGTFSARLSSGNFSSNSSLRECICLPQPCNIGHFICKNRLTGMRYHWECTINWRILWRCNIEVTSLLGFPETWEHWTECTYANSCCLVNSIMEFHLKMVLVTKHRLRTPNAMKPFFIEIQNFWVGQTDWADKFWGIWGIFGQTISTHFCTVNLLFIFSIIQPLFL